jgi:quercetin dioxygenase-like cupin family protein
MAKISVKENVKFAPEKMTRITLAATGRLQMDLYCLSPGQSQKAHTHTDLDKVYYVVEGSGRFTLGGREEELRPGEALTAPSGIEHGLVNDGPDPLVVLVIVVPPPAH